MGMKALKLFVIALCLVLAIGFVAGHFMPRSPYSHALLIGNTKISVAYAVTPQEQEQGLSGTTKLPMSRGMLFVFPEDTTTLFWMKDMQYSLDIIWIGTDKRVVDISPDLAPSTYPATFGPKAPIRYALEVPAGFAKANDVTIGTKVAF
jgi:uncharacterized membrane protein (UPF0127 family)